METNSKFSKFVAKLEQKMLDGNQESMILTGILDSKTLIHLMAFVFILQI